MSKITIQTLLDAGTHFGHQNRRWNPKMKPFIFGTRGDIYIIDLKQTLVGIDACLHRRFPLPKRAARFCS